ncbi:MAG: ABC transporter permease subunit [Firmicutes bacterium]|nr:ABC transporter permease subunit [Bacillota bacterium]
MLLDAPHRYQGQRGLLEDIGREWGSFLQLAAGMLAAAIAMGLGVTIGLVSGYVGGAVDQVLMRLMDIMLAFPYLLLAMIVVAILGPSISKG